MCAVLLGEDTNTLVRRLREWFPNAQLSAADHAFVELVDKTLSRAEPPLAARALPRDVRAAVLCQRIRAALRDLPAADQFCLTNCGEYAAGFEPASEPARSSVWSM